MLDIILLIFIGLAAFGGWRKGAVTMLLSLVILVLAAYIASIFSVPVGNFLRVGQEWMRPIVGFIFVFAVLMLVGSAFSHSMKPKSGLSKSLDRTLGAILGAIRGVIILGFLLLLISKVGLPPNSMVDKSMFYKPVLHSATLVASALRPLLPTGL